MGGVKKLQRVHTIGLGTAMGIKDLESQAIMCVIPTNTAEATEHSGRSSGTEKTRLCCESSGKWSSGRWEVLGMFIFCYQMQGLVTCSVCENLSSCTHFYVWFPVYIIQLKVKKKKKKGLGILFILLVPPVTEAKPPTAECCLLSSAGQPLPKARALQEHCKSGEEEHSPAGLSTPI